MLGTTKVCFKRRSKEVAELRKVEIVLSSEKWDNHFRHTNFISILSEMILRISDDDKDTNCKAVA